MTNWAGHMPGILNLQIIRGARLVVPLSFEDADGPLDLTGYQVRAALKRGVTTVGFSIEGTLDNQGKCSLVMDVATTRTLPLGSAEWELEFAIGDEVVPMLRGSVLVLTEIVV